MISYVNVVTYLTTLLMNEFTNIVILITLSSSTVGICCILHLCDELLSWMIEIWMKNHLVSDRNCNIVNLQCPNNVRFTLSVGVQVVFEQNKVNW